MSIIDTLITDRTAADTAALEALFAKAKAGSLTEEEKAILADPANKGAYNYTDLNRVGAAVEYVAGRFQALGYNFFVSVKKGWSESDTPTASQMEVYRQNIATLRRQIAVMQSTPKTPETMRFLDYIKANDIERILLDLDTLLDKLTKSWYFSGELYAGEV